MRLLLSLLIAFPLAALQDGSFSGANTLRFTGQSQSISDYRLEFRLSAFTLDGSKPQGVMGNNSLSPQCVILQNTLTLRCRDNAGTSNTLTVDITSRPDVRVRFQRVSGLRLLETWNADGTGYTASSFTDTASVFNFNESENFVGSIYPSSECACKIGFARWWSTTVAAASPAPPDVLTVTVSNLVDLELEGNTNDTSGNSNTITTSGGALSYATTIVYPPSAIVSTVTGCRAGSTCSLSGASSSGLYSDAPLVFFWNSVAWSTSPPVFSTRTTSTPTISIPVASTVTVRLTVTDANGSKGSADTQVGSAATDGNSVVILPSSTVQTILGPVLLSSASPWTWFDTTEVQVADALLATFPESPGDSPMVGTVAVTNGSTTVTGTGTSFLSNCSDLMVVIYPVDGQPGVFGRRSYDVVSCGGNTTATLSTAYDASASASGVQYQFISNSTNAQWVNGSNNWNYYDAVAALYRLYYRTGNDKYLTGARSLADKWWVYPIDGGRGSVAGARSLAFTGLILRALDGKPEYWDGLVPSILVNYNIWLNGYYPFQPNTDIGEIREQGYVAIYTLLIGLYHPDSSVRTTWMANSALALSYFVANQRAYGGWSFTLDASQNYYGAGNFPWQGGFLAQFLRIYHAATGSTTARDALKAYIDYYQAEGFDPSNSGAFYEDTHFTFCPDYGSEKTGSVTVNNGSTTVTGSGTLFTSQFGCNGTDRIGIQDATGFRRAYTVSSCSGNTSMTISSAYAGANQVGARILRYAGSTGAAPSACHVSYGTDPAAVKDSRTLNNAIHWMYGWAFQQGYGDIYKTNGDILFSQNLGLGGTGNDGIVGHYNDVITGGTAPSYLATTYLSKEYAFVGGASGSQPYLALRLGTPSPESLVDVSVGVKISAVPTATKVRVTLTRPSGSTSTATCTSSPCVVTADSRQGTSALLLIEYLDTSNKVLSTGQPQRVSI